ncbi:helix-turn-helix domain-containing protein [Sunxiuqinia rutila]|uniref:helix-turn-helix domain-containing protein n=1 Tax=Sunxiuqinia rutila TaxID=1397841 RepID=UPI003D3618AB
MLHYNLRYLLEIKGIANPYNFLIKQGLTPNVATRSLNGKITQLKLNHLSAICRALHCTPNDLMEWEDDGQEPLPENHPLQALVREQIPLNIRGQLRELTFNQLKEVRSLITRLKEAENNPGKDAES